MHDQLAVLARDGRKRRTPLQVSPRLSLDRDG
jgi:hypothetical protein